MSNHPVNQTRIIYGKLSFRAEASLSVACAFLWAWWVRSRISPAKLPQVAALPMVHAFVDPLFELGDLFFGPGTVAGHAAVSESPVDGISPRFNAS